MIATINTGNKMVSPNSFIKDLEESILYVRKELSKKGDISYWMDTLTLYCNSVYWELHRLKNDMPLTCFK